MSENLISEKEFAMTDSTFASPVGTHQSGPTSPGQFQPTTIAVDLPVRPHPDDGRPLSRTTTRVIQMLLGGDLSRLRSESIADELGISPTTLRRRLRADDTNYQALLDQVRQYRCEKQLAERWLPGKCLAWELGYAEVNSFYRAFRRWTGLNYSEIKLRYV